MQNQGSQGHQFTLNPQGIFLAGPTGVVVHDTRPQRATACGSYAERPVQFSVHRDLRLQLHGARFVVTMQLTDEDALSLISLLSFTLRERQLPVPRG